MDDEMKTKWVAALRSGDYKQRTGMLRDDGRFCCLGVLCDLVDPSAWKDTKYGWSYHGCQGDLPTEVNARFSIPVGAETDLVRMNDNGSSFEDIADYIEANL